MTILKYLTAALVCALSASCNAPMQSSSSVASALGPTGLVVTTTTELQNLFNMEGLSEADRKKSMDDFANMAPVDLLDHYLDQGIPDTIEINGQRYSGLSEKIADLGRSVRTKLKDYTSMREMALANNVDLSYHAMTAADIEASVVTSLRQIATTGGSAGLGLRPMAPSGAPAPDDSSGGTGSGVGSDTGSGATSGVGSTVWVQPQCKIAQITIDAVSAAANHMHGATVPASCTSLAVAMGARLNTAGGICTAVSVIVSAVWAGGSSAMNQYCTRAG